MGLFAPDIDPVKQLPNKKSSFGQWLEWYKAFQAYYGTKAANFYFVKRWDSCRPDSWSALADFANRHVLIDYLKKNGLKLDTNGVDEIADFSYSITDNIGSALKVGKYAVYGILGLGAIILIAITVSIVRNPNAAISSAAKGAKFL